MSKIVVRHRRGLVVGGVVLAVAQIVAAPIAPVPVFVACAAIGIPLLVVAMVDGWRHNRRPPAAFEIDEQDRSFRTPRLANGVLMMLAALQLFVFAAGFTVWSAAHGDVFWTGVAAILLLGWLLATNAPLAWRGHGLTLRPDGIHADKSSGALVIPWDALVAERPGRGDERWKIKLGYARPDLVTSTGWVQARDEVTIEGTDDEFVLSAIHTYAAEPGRRHAIGTVAEHDLLVAGRPATPPRTAEPATPGQTVARTIGGLALFLGALALEMALHDRYHYVAMAMTFPSAAGLGLLIRAFTGHRAARRQTRMRAQQ